MIFGFTVYDSFEGVGADGEVPIPKPSVESILGGHAVTIVGYDDTKFGGSFRVHNSWGDKWGDNGGCWMKYLHITNAKLASDFWTINDVPATDANS